VWEGGFGFIKKEVRLLIRRQTNWISLGQTLGFQAFLKTFLVLTKTGSLDFRDYKFLQRLNFTGL